MKFITSWLSIVTCLLMLATAGAPARAGVQPGLLDLYSHRAWTAAQGAPAQIQAITQTHDGWLWLSTPTGLYRFDGVRFDRHDAIDGNALRSSIVLPLHTTPDGTLWVGYRFGGASAFINGTVRHYGPEQGFPPGATHSFTVAPDGVVWATTSRGLAWLDSKTDRWIRIQADAGFTPDATIWQVLYDRAGTQWVSSANKVFYRRAGQQHYLLASPTNITLASLAAAPDGTLWVSNGTDANYRVTTTAANRPAAPQPELPGSGMWFDRAGAMWLASATLIERAADASQVGNARQQLAHDRGLSGLSPQTFYEDRDGNIWIGTASGLDQFRRNRVTPLPTPQPGAAPVVTPALAAAGAGQVWLSDGNDTWLTDHHGDRQPGVGRGFGASTRGRDGRLWLAGERGIWRADTPRTLIAPPVFPNHDDTEAHALAEARDGTLWAAFLNHPVYRYDQASGRWDAPYATLPEARIMALLADSEDRLWVGYQGNRIARIEHGAIRVFDAADGLRIGNTLSIVEHHGQLWVAGEQGVARYDGERFVALRTVDGRELRGITGLVFAGGDLWLRGHDGALRIAAEQVHAFLRKDAKVQYQLLGSEEGVGGNVQPTGPFPAMVEATDGRLWVSGTSGAMLINPAGIRHEALPPTVDIVSLSSDGKTRQLADVVHLPAGTNNLHLTFTAPGLAVPEGLRFRYRLLGVDDAWQDAGDRREAFYTNMAPGDYRFQVIAANRDGVWNTAGATLVITIPPTFVESLWFKALCALTLLAVVVLAWRWRVAQMARLIEARHMERLHERERIARALHDTFLQEAQGTVLMMHTAMAQIPPSLPARAAMERGIGYIEKAMIEGRDEVMGLRSSARADEPLAAALQRYGERLAAGLPPSFRMQTRGTPRTLAPLVKDEVFAIGREAICNAFRHANATEIELDLVFDAGGLSMLVSDNGQGIPPAALARGEHGRWGLVGMRERASDIGATLEVGNREVGNGIGGAYMRLTLPLMYGNA
jgi:signal transduction histidine kinase/ligand-binding sensor domain-containing protein